ncbi:hypothetical protein KC367_g12 [Hortaea werneckii]|nr:hypothetical protein KC367_g12 [Hortaea werneckii]
MIDILLFRHTICSPTLQTSTCRSPHLPIDLHIPSNTPTLSTNVKPRDTRIMITDDIRRTNPTTNMDMLELRPHLLPPPRRQARGDIHMIELLGIDAKGIRIALDILNAHDFIQIAESADVLEKRKRLDPSELVEIACGDDSRVLVLGEEGGDERAGGRGSPCKLDEPPLEGFPGGDERFAAVGPGVVGGVDEARVVFEFGAGEDHFGVGGAAGVGVAEADGFGVVEVGVADVAAWLAASTFEPAALIAETRSESVVLAETTSSFVAPLLSCTSWRKTRSGVRKYVTIWAAMSSSVAELGERFSTFQLRGVRTIWIKTARIADSSLRDTIVEAELVRDDTSDVLEAVTKLDVIRMLVHPDLVRTTQSARGPDSHQLTIDALPEVQTVKLWLEVPSTKGVTSLFEETTVIPDGDVISVTMSPTSTLLRPESPKT